MIGPNVLEILNIQEDPGSIPDFLNILVPEPAGSLEDEPDTSTTPGSMPKWYAWRLANWGCKWDTTLHVYTANSKRLTGAMQTPWGPPVQALAIWGEKNPRVKIDLRYYEGGRAFKGHFIMKKGIVIKDEISTYRGCRSG